VRSGRKLEDVALDDAEFELPSLVDKRKPGRRRAPLPYTALTTIELWTLESEIWFLLN